MPQKATIASLNPRTETLSAGIPVPFGGLVDYIKIRALSGSVKIALGTLGQGFCEIAVGSEIKLREPVDGFRLTSDAGCTVTFISSYGVEVRDTQMSASVTVAKAGTIVPTPDVTVLGTATLLKAATARQSITLTALVGNAGVVRIGDATVTTGSGHPLYPGASVTLETTAAVYAIGPATSEKVAILEEV